MNLSDWRRRIDELDRKLVELLNERSQCALEVGRLKQQANLPLYQPDREKEVLENAEKNNRGPLSDAAIRRLFERIIDEARAAERLTLIDLGLDPKSLVTFEVGHLELRPEFESTLTAYQDGSRDGLSVWIGHCADAIVVGARETTAICEAIARG